ncbi:conserved protein of unknown function [Pseudodesulfovibrio profundus]|uniref:Uncharacterized protein n=1 Tax=Pseudodesulfovibrio profundus TaxID=57320 RepID=A0A2C8FDM1_9BACT|nr:phage regulatory CII family protein [Pseudodesulfovibrio profundus]SOB60561.1 conserved protein of unknown function [Pseudodesulfovibrio profundus]
MEHSFVDAKTLAGLAPEDAFKQAFALSGLTQQQLMERMGWKIDKTRRVFATGRYFPSYEELPKFCTVVGNTIILKWLQFNVLLADQDMEHVDIDCQELIMRAGELYSEVGDVGQYAAKAIEDGKLDLKEIRKLKEEVGQVATKAFETLGDLGAMERKLKGQTTKGE